jgi:seryl-tRNA synthetase
MKASARQHINVEELQDYKWNPAGYSSLGGRSQDLYIRLDKMFLGWAGELNASVFSFPIFIDAQELSKIGYFASFPHLVTLAVCPDGRQVNLEKFAQSPVTERGTINLTEHADINQVLTPAACYHFYVQLQNSIIGDSQTFTTCCPCFRREDQYKPLQRQWNFNMREIVCIGTANEVRAFLEKSQSNLGTMMQRLALPVQFANATDPFFNPAKNPKFLMQKLDPVKTELIFDNELAIGSFNFHHNYFGEAFNIKTKDEKFAYSGCVAFGLERWMYMYLNMFGTQPGAVYPFPSLFNQEGS